MSDQDGSPSGPGRPVPGALGPAGPPRAAPSGSPTRERGPRRRRRLRAGHPRRRRGERLRGPSGRLRAVRRASRRVRRDGAHAGDARGVAGRRARRAPGPARPEPPAPRLLDGLVDEVARKRSQRRRRTRYLIAAAAVLVIGGPVVAVTATAGEDSGRQVEAADPHPTSPAEDAFFHHMPEKLSGDRSRHPGRRHGRHGAQGLGHAHGPGTEERQGPAEVQPGRRVQDGRRGGRHLLVRAEMGIRHRGNSAHASAQHPLYVHGGAAMARGDIDHFEVRTFDGERLVEIDAGLTATQSGRQVRSGPLSRTVDGCPMHVRRGPRWPRRMPLSIRCGTGKSVSNKNIWTGSTAVSKRRSTRRNFSCRTP